MTTTATATTVFPAGITTRRITVKRRANTRVPPFPRVRTCCGRRYALLSRVRGDVRGRTSSLARAYERRICIIAHTLAITIAHNSRRDNCISVQPRSRCTISGYSHNRDDIHRPDFQRPRPRKRDLFLSCSFPSAKLLRYCAFIG